MKYGRLTWLAPDDMTEASREVYEAIAGGPRASAKRLFQMSDGEGRLEGPFNAMVSAPTVGMALQEVGSAIRYRTGLSDRVREIAILTLAAYRGSDFETYAHEAVGAAVGLTTGELAALREGSTDASFSEDERVVHAVCTALLVGRSLSSDQYAAAVEALGVEGAIELIVLVGYYDTLDLMMSALETPLPEGVVI